MKSLSQRVEEAIEAGFSVTELAHAAGLTSAAVSHWRQGRTVTLKAKSVDGLARHTGWSASWWATGKGERQPKGKPAPAADWPFRMVDQRMVADLDPHTLGMLEHAMLQVIEKADGLGGSATKMVKRDPKAKAAA